MTIYSNIMSSPLFASEANEFRLSASELTTTVKKLEVINFVSNDCAIHLLLPCLHKLTYCSRRLVTPFITLAQLLV